MDVKSLVEQEFGEPTPCYGHCQEQSTLRFLSTDPNLVACFACPAGYVSRIAHYGEDLDLGSFKRFLSSILKGGQRVEDGDIRIATRYSWDLGVESESGKVMRAAYWTQNYRRTKTESPNRVAVFLCSNCNTLFLQTLTSANQLCEECR